MSLNLNISINDFNKICRTCAAKGEMRNIYDKYIDNSRLLEILVKVTFLQIEHDDGLPVNICVNCEKQLIQAYNFAKMCSSVDLKLRECLNETKNVEMIDKDPLEIDEWVENPNFSPQYVPEVSEISQVPEVSEPVKQIKLEELDIKEEIDLTESLDVDEDEDDEDVITSNPILFVEAIKPETEESPSYSCKKCFQEFSSNELLKQHQKQEEHFAKKQKCCKICSKLISYQHFRQHMRIHTDERPYCCHVCNNRFRAKSTLNNHVLCCHSNIKPFKCEICNKEFNRLVNLTSHRRKHSGEKPYSCLYCPRTFSYPTSLRKHIVSHNRRKN